MKWIGVGIEDYTLELEDHNAPLNKEDFKEFTWINKYSHRLLLWGNGKRSYVLYGPEEQLKKFQRYYQVENIEVKQLGVFKTLDSHFKQKIVTLFGNKVRFYDHFLKIRKAEKDAQLSTIQKDEQPISSFDNSEFKNRDR